MISEFQYAEPLANQNMGIDPYVGCQLAIPRENCTLDTCCLAQSAFRYRVGYAGNLFFMVFFAFFVVPQVSLGFWKRTWSYMIGMVSGLILEVAGYVARLLLHRNPFSAGAFLL